MGISRAPSGLGFGQTWQTVTRTHNVTYTNATGKPIMLKFAGTAGASAGSIYVEMNGQGVLVCHALGNQNFAGTVVVAVGATYKPTMTNIASSFAMELR